MRDVSVLRADRRVLDEVHVDIPGDGVTALWGDSGAGKTTMLRLLNRLDVPDSGTITYQGTDIAELDVHQHRRRVGMVFQRPVAFAGTVADNLAVAAVDSDRDAMADALRRVSLEPDLLDRDADSLSGGELQRVCLARTLITEPETLLLDEPTSALDERPARAFEDTVLELTGRGLAAIWVGHDEAQVERVSDRVLVVRDGAVTAQREESA
nr:ATP-binding cassette domain-containing protein [Actinomycetospora corticicola]